MDTTRKFRYNTENTTFFNVTYFLIIAQ